MSKVAFKLENNIPAVVNDLRSEAGLLVAQTAMSIHSRAALAINNPPKTGWVYRKRGKSHQASAPGQAPAGDTGYLANSIQADMTGPLSAAVTVGAEYGEVLELGGRNTGARPYLAPAVEAERPKFESAVAKLVKKWAQKS